MRTIEKQSTQLAQKQSHVRNSFKKWINKWAENAPELNDYSLDNVPITTIIKDGQWPELYYLKRGDNELYYCLESHFDISEGSAGTIVDIDTVDMQYLRVVLSNIEQSIDKHIDRLKRTEQEYNNLLQLL